MSILSGAPEPRGVMGRRVPAYDVEGREVLVYRARHRKGIYRD
jgi:hypothetical protein